jgi:hypothetical protein
MFFSLPPSLSLLSVLLLQHTASIEAYKPLSDSFLRAIPSPSQDIDPHNGSLLAPILIPRVPGTPGQATTQNHFVNYFQTELPKWSMEWQNSTSRTPVSGGTEVPFANLIFKREPPWVKPGQSNFLTLVAHYDSKYQPEGFIGATDSAAPCAMMMFVAKVIDGYVQRMYDEMQELEEGGTVEMDMGVQILFLDGEEAFEKWTDKDSLYGARYVAHISIANNVNDVRQSPRTTMGYLTQPAIRKILQIPQPTQPDISVPPPRPPRLRQSTDPFLFPHHALGVHTSFQHRVSHAWFRTSRVAAIRSVFVGSQQNNRRIRSR